MTNELDNFIQIIKPKDSEKLTKAEKNGLLYFCKYTDYYPVTVKISAEQLNAAKEICDSCKTSLIAVLSETISNIYHIAENNNTLQVTNPTYQFYHYVHDLNVLGCKITNYHNAIKRIDKIVTDSNNILNTVEDILDKSKLDNDTVQKQLIIFRPLNNNTYEELSNLDNKLQKLNITTISKMFKELIDALLNKELMSESDYQFTIVNKDNISRLNKEITKK